MANRELKDRMQTNFASLRVWASIFLIVGLLAPSPLLAEDDCIGKLTPDTVARFCGGVHKYRTETSLRPACTQGKLFHAEIAPKNAAPASSYLFYQVQTQYSSTKVPITHLKGHWQCMGKRSLSMPDAEGWIIWQKQQCPSPPKERSLKQVPEDVKVMHRRLGSRLIKKRITYRNDIRYIVQFYVDGLVVFFSEQSSPKRSAYEVPEICTIDQAASMAKYIFNEMKKVKNDVLII